MANSIHLRSLPFAKLSDYELECFFKSSKNEIMTKLENPSLLNYLKNKTTQNNSDRSVYDIDCKYYTEADFNLAIKDIKGSLSVFHMNIRKLGKHRGDLLAFLSCINLKFDVIILTEVGKDSSCYIENLFDEYISGYDLPKNNDYGGVAILVKNKLSPSIRNDLKMKKSCDCTKCNFENTWMEFTYQGRIVTVGGMYRHPGGVIPHFTKDLDTTLVKIDNNNISILGGDTNIDLIHANTNNVDYATTLAAHNYIPYITRPTRITSHSATLIDHLFLKVSPRDIDKSVLSGNFFCDISDHLPNFLVLPWDQSTHKNTDKKKVRIYSESNILKFIHHIFYVPWSQELNTFDNVNSMCSHFMSKINHFFCSSFPLTEISKKRSKDKPWITQDLRKQIQNKNKLYRKKLTNPTEENETLYKESKRAVEIMIKTVQEKYYQDILNNKRNSVKAIWDEFGPILGKQKKKIKKIKKLHYKGKLMVGDDEIAKSMNENFCNIGPNLAAKIDQTGVNFNDYLGQQNDATFFLHPVPESDVLEELLKLNHKKSPGPDGYTPKIVKACAYVLYEPLSIVYNKSILSGVYPDCFKLAKIIPIYKSGSFSDPSNYRPISLLNCFNKVFEKMINKQLSTFIKRQGLLFKHQYAFREGYSTAMALIEMTDYIKREIDKGNYISTLFIDLKKAFDTVDHNILLHKLSHYGIRGHSNQFLQSYLDSRKQYVHCNNTSSETRGITCGVPQGSILGPTLFLIYVNDMFKCVNDDLRLFADDTICMSAGNSIKCVFEKTRENISKLKKWFDANKLTLNLSKTCYSIFHSIAKNIPQEFNSIIFSGTEIKRENTTMYLGLTIDEVLSWKKHIDDLIASLTRYFSLFYHLRNVIPKKMKLQMFHSYVYTKICYGLQCYGSACKTTKKKVQVICNKLLKVIMKKDSKYSTNKLYKENNLLKIDDMHKYVVLQFVHKSVYADDNSPETLRTYFVRNDNSHSVRDNLLLNIPRARNAIVSTTVYWLGASLWNKLPYHIRKEQDIKTFKEKLKDNMLSMYIDQEPST